MREWLTAPLHNFEYKPCLTVYCSPFAIVRAQFLFARSSPDPTPPALPSLPPVSLNKHTHRPPHKWPPEPATVVIYAPVEAIPLWTVPDYECQFQATPGVHPSLGREKKKHLTASSLLSLPSSNSLPPCEDGVEHDFIWRREDLKKNVRGVGFQSESKTPEQQSTGDTAA